VGGTAALLAEHFLARYVALEVVALCVALAPLAEMREDADSAVRGRWAQLVYLVLRVGDAGLLPAILALWAGTGTLEIAPALEAGTALPQPTLGWIAGGMLLAVWVKVGGLPLHIWQQAGRLLSPAARSWLYRTLTPNLGLYLLYRVTPLLVASPPVRAVAAWVGALGALWAGILALRVLLSGPQNTPDGSLDRAAIYLGAAQGGLALALAATGQKAEVWLLLLALTPLRLLLDLAGRLVGEARRAGERQAAALLYGLGAALLAGLDALIVWWVREAGAPLAVRLVSGAAVGLVGAWAALSTVRAWRDAPSETPRAPAAVRGWTVAVLLACGFVAALLWRRPLLDHLARAAHGDPFALPTPAGAVGALATGPAGWVAFVLALRIERLAFRDLLPGVARKRPEVDLPLALERGLQSSAKAVHTVVEAGILGRTLGGSTQGVLEAAQLSHRWIEGVVLHGATEQIAQSAADGGRLAYEMMEQGGLEGLLRRTVDAVMAASRWLQRRHTGRLRRNLIWVVASLLLAALGLVLSVW
jgi:hypothetical protein